MNGQSLPTQATANCKPVVKKPRRKWIIPRADAGERWQQQQHEEAYLRKLGQGTTPHGRELLRHLFWSIERALRTGTKTRTEIEAFSAGTIAREKMLEPEWALLVARLLNTDPEPLINGSDLLLGKLIVVMAAQSLQIQAAKGTLPKLWVVNGNNYILQ
jgi:hypothetical protein